MSTSATSDPRVLLCGHCTKRIDIWPDTFIWVISKEAHAGAPFTCRTQRADFIVGDDEMAFGSIACIKKWLLKWVDIAASESRKAGRA